MQSFYYNKILKFLPFAPKIITLKAKSYLLSSTNQNCFAFSASFILELSCTNLWNRKNHMDYEDSIKFFLEIQTNIWNRSFSSLKDRFCEEVIALRWPWYYFIDQKIAFFLIYQKYDYPFWKDCSWHRGIGRNVGKPI